MKTVQPHFKVVLQVSLDNLKACSFWLKIKFQVPTLVQSEFFLCVSLTSLAILTLIFLESLRMVIVPNTRIPLEDECKSLQVSQNLKRASEF